MEHMYLRDMAECTDGCNQVAEDGYTLLHTSDILYQPFVHHLHPL